MEVPTTKANLLDKEEQKLSQEFAELREEKDTRSQEQLLHLRQYLLDEQYSTIGFEYRILAEKAVAIQRVVIGQKLLDTIGKKVEKE